jgi:hypothetical protein
MFPNTGCLFPQPAIFLTEALLDLKAFLCGVQGSLRHRGQAHSSSSHAARKVST